MINWKITERRILDYARNTIYGYKRVNKAYKSILMNRKLKLVVKKENLRKMIKY